MLDMKFLRENPEAVKENIKKKFQGHKVELVDKVITMDKEDRSLRQQRDELWSKRNIMNKEAGGLVAKNLKDGANAIKAKVQAMADEMKETKVEGTELAEKIKEMMMQVPNIIHPTTPVGRDDSENVKLQKYGEPVIPDFKIPYHTGIMKRFEGIDLDSVREIAGNGFYCLMGDIARFHSAIISYARDFMIDRRFTYVVPPFMVRNNVVTEVTNFAEMEDVMYKIEGENLYLIGASKHSMIGRFIGTILGEKKLPHTYTSYSLCFRGEKDAHGIEERGVYRVHQFEKQGMIVIYKPKESADWFVELYTNIVDLFKSLDIPVRTLECCSDDLADLRNKSVDVEAWSSRRRKYFEVGSCSNLTDTQARRLGIRIEGGNRKYFAHTSNNTMVAPPRILIAFLENDLNKDGSVNILEKLQPYMGGTKILIPKN